MTKTIYPRYSLKWLTQIGSGSYHTRRKKAFLLRLDRLSALSTLKRVNFSVTYLPDVVNESIDYSKNELREAKKTARAFTSAEEIRFAQDYWKETINKPTVR